MIVIFPMLVSKNVNTNLVQGLAITLEKFIAAEALSDFVGHSKEFNKYYDYKIKRGKIYQESEVSWFDIDPATRTILEEQERLGEEIVDRYGNPIASGRGGIPPRRTRMNPRRTAPDPVDRSAGESAARSYLGKKGVADIDPQEELPKTDPTKKKGGKSAEDKAEDVLTQAQDVGKKLKNWQQNREANGKETIPTPKFSKADILSKSISLEPTWVEVIRADGKGTSRLGIKVIPMMIEGFNIKHTISKDMERFFIGTFLTGVGRKIMRFMYRMLDRWTSYGQRPRGELKHDLFYARTGHDGKPFVLLDVNEDIPRIFFYQSQNMLKLWKLSWGNLLMADDSNKTVMFCMKKYKGMCTTFSYPMLFAQTKEMARVFEDMEDARKATSSLFRFNKKITQLGGRK